MKKPLTFLVVFLILCYPFAVYFGLHYFSPRYIALGIAFVFLLRFILLHPTTASSSKVILVLITLAGVATSIVGTISNNALIIKLYPCVMNLLMLGIFAYSLYYPPTIIERLARLKTPDLPTEAIAYTKTVTIAWCVFFIINGSIALWTTLFATDKIWALYNGFLSYLCIGAVFVIELAIRQWVKRKWCHR